MFWYVSRDITKHQDHDDWKYYQRNKPYLIPCYDYEILLDVAVRDRTIQMKILGLRTTPLIMPGVGPARGQRDFTDLLGLYHLNVIKLNGETNEFQVDLTPSNITITGTPTSPFITVSNKPVALQ